MQKKKNNNNNKKKKKKIKLYKIKIKRMSNTLTRIQRGGGEQTFMGDLTPSIFIVNFFFFLTLIICMGTAYI